MATVLLLTLMQCECAGVLCCIKQPNASTSVCCLLLSHAVTVRLTADDVLGASTMAGCIDEGLLIPIPDDLMVDAPLPQHNAPGEIPPLYTLEPLPHNMQPAVLSATLMRAMRLSNSTQLNPLLVYTLCDASNRLHCR